MGLLDAHAAVMSGDVALEVEAHAACADRVVWWDDASRLGEGKSVSASGTEVREVLGCLP